MQWVTSTPVIYMLCISWLYDIEMNIEKLLQWFVIDNFCQILTGWILGRVNHCFWTH